MRLVNADEITMTRQEYVGALTLRERLQRLLNSQPTVEAIPIKDIKDFLRCEKIDTCDWLNCSECSQMKCISIRNLNDLIEWSKGRENEID